MRLFFLFGHIDEEVCQIKHGQIFRCEFSVERQFVEQSLALAGSQTVGRNASCQKCGDRMLCRMLHQSVSEDAWSLLGPLSVTTRPFPSMGGRAVV